MTDITSTTPTTDTFTKTIWVSRKPAFEVKIKLLNRILQKQGKSPISFTYTNYRTKRVEFTHHTKGDAFKNDIVDFRNVEICDAVCTGSLIVQKDNLPFTYIGSVSIEDGIRQVFCKDEKFSPFFTTDFREGFCDHCHSLRHNRKSYHLFALPDSSVVQIGSSCAKQYFGISSSAFLETYGKTFFVSYDGFDEELPSFRSGSCVMPYSRIVPFLDYATKGFTKWNKKDSCSDFLAPLHDQPTTEAVRTLIAAEEQSLSGWESIQEKFYQHNAANLNLTLQDCIDFWTKKSLSEHPVSTFTFNALETLKAGYATNRSLGSFCYAVFAAFNNKVNELLNSSKADFAPCRFAKNSRVDISGYIVNIRSWSDEVYFTYRPQEITKYTVDFKDDAGTLYHFTTSGSTFASLRNNSPVSIRATIGETKPFKGIPYTNLSRPVATLLEPSPVL